MKKYFFTILSIISFSTAVVAKEKTDTCTYHFVENGALINLSKFLSLDKLIMANENKDFYIAIVTFETSSNRKIIIKECSSIGDEKVILFNDTVTSFNYNGIKVDSSILFNHIGDSKTVTYAAVGCGSGYHTPLQVLIFKFHKKYVLGYSPDGSNLISSLKQIITEYFVFGDKLNMQQLFLIIDSVGNDKSVPKINAGKIKSRKRNYP